MEDPKKTFSLHSLVGVFFEGKLHLKTLNTLNTDIHQRTPRENGQKHRNRSTAVTTTQPWRLKTKYIGYGSKKGVGTSKTLWVKGKIDPVFATCGSPSGGSARHPAIFTQLSTGNKDRTVCCVSGCLGLISWTSRSLPSFGHLLVLSAG